MGQLVDGVWCQDPYKCDTSGRFLRDATTFRGQVRADGSTPFLPEAGRYHLYVSYACPWAHRTILMRALKGLEGVIGMSVVHPYMGEEGWHFEGSPWPDTILGSRRLREVYLRAEPRYTGRVTVPVLWDRATGTIVNNESRQLMRMLDVEFSGLAAPGAPDFYPEELQAEVDRALDALYDPINNGVYRVGFATSQQAYQEALELLYGALGEWEQRLARQRFLCGDRVTEADWALFTTMLRFDPVYAIHFKCSRLRLVDHPHLCVWMRRLYGIEGVASTCRMDHITEHYYRSHPFLNPRGLVPALPARDFLSG